MRVVRQVASTLVALAIAGAYALTTTPPVLAAAPAASADSIFVVSVGGEGLDAAIKREADVDPAYRDKALMLARAWQAQLAAGNQIALQSITKDRTSQQSSDTLARLEASLQLGANSTSSTAAATATADSHSLTAQPDSAAVTPMVSGLNPNLFPVRGYPMGDKSYWKYLTLIVAGRYCLPNGCGEDTDRITCNITVNPGAVTSRFDSSCGYFPNAGNFQNKHYDLWAINRGSVVGSTTTGNLFSGTGGTSPYYLTNNFALNSTVLTSAAALWAYATPLGTYVEDAAKTADATCRAPGDNRCFYS